MSPFGATVIAVGLNLLQLQSRFLGKPELQHDVPGFGVELDPFGVGIAGAVNEFALGFVADLHVVDVRVFVSHEAADHFPVRREDEDPQLRAGVDVPRLVDHDAAVSRTDDRFPVCPRVPSRGPCRRSSIPQPIRTGWTFPPRKPARQGRRRLRRQGAHATLHDLDSWWLIGGPRWRQNPVLPDVMRIDLCETGHFFKNPTFRSSDVSVFRRGYIDFNLRAWWSARSRIDFRQPALAQVGQQLGDLAIRAGRSLP